MQISSFIDRPSVSQNHDQLKLCHLQKAANQENEATIQMQRCVIASTTLHKACFN
jgi:hypothetical protein